MIKKTDAPRVQPTRFNGIRSTTVSSSTIPPSSSPRPLPSFVPSHGSSSCFSLSLPLPLFFSPSFFLSLSPGPVFPEACFPVNNRGDSRAARGEQRNSIEFQHSRPRVSACSSRDRVNGRPRGCAESGRLSREFRPRRESTLSYTRIFVRIKYLLPPLVRMEINFYSIVENSLSLVGK